MSSYLEASNAAARAVLCSYFSITDQLGRVVRAADDRFAVPMPFVYDWFRRLCNQEPPEQPSVEPEPPPFTGGQCPVLYIVNYSVTYDTRSIPPPNIITDTFQITFVYGTIKGIRIERGSSLEQVFIIGGGSTNPSDTVEYGAFAVGTGGEGIISASIVSVARQDGLPDNCGDPPSGGLPPYIPPDDSTTDYPIDYTDNDGNDFTVDVRFTLGNLQLDIDNNITVPFTLSFSPEFNLSLNGTINQNGDVNISYGNPNYNPGGKKYGKRNPDNSVPEDNLPETPEDVEEPTIPPPPDEDEEEQTGVIRAVIVTTTVMSDKQSLVYQDVNPDIAIPRLGNVAFLIAVGNRVAWTDDIPVRNKRHFIVCPWEGGAIDVRGTPAVGNNFTLTKVYAREQYPVTLLT